MGNETNVQWLIVCVISVPKITVICCFLFSYCSKPSNMFFGTQCIYFSLPFIVSMVLLFDNIHSSIPFTHLLVINVETEFIYKCYRLTHRKQQKLEL